ncbi:MAG: hypothetical protein J0M19_00730 [Sphingomonadales bacterium]|jgi:exopolyphosphatase/pppGpp-phosphohydrolase|nr:hypothetical protein [Sphingomonadales bacterium]
MISSICSTERYFLPKSETTQIERLAVIEIGSRASRLTVADVSRCSVRVVGTNHEVSNLFLLVADSEVDLALEKLKITLERFRRKAAKMGAHRIRVIGTEAIRLLAERSLLSREFGIEVLSPSEEAHLAFLGAAAGLGFPESARDFLLIDQGAGSMEVAGGRLRPSPQLSQSASTGLGAKVAEAIFERTGCCVPTFSKHVSSVIKKSLEGHNWSKSRSVTVLGGTATRLGWMAVGAKGSTRYSASQVHGVQFNVDCLLKVINGFQTSSAAQLRSFAQELAVGSKAGPNWNEFLASSLAICEAARFLGAQEIRVSTTGTRLGALVSMRFDRKCQSHDQYIGKPGR